ncbi:hypothetical protein KRMM14A1004_40020 [Krasilnikovia sp. MM14-A1004]
MTRLVPVKVGDVVRVAEDDYCYGLGCLTLRITRVHGVVILADEPWVAVDGIPLWPQGVEGEERFAQIRVAAVHHLPQSGIEQQP